MLPTYHTAKFICYEASEAGKRSDHRGKILNRTEEKVGRTQSENLFFPSLVENSFNENQTKNEMFANGIEALSYHSLQPTNRLENRRR